MIEITKCPLALIPTQAQIVVQIDLAMTAEWKLCECIFTGIASIKTEYIYKF